MRRNYLPVLARYFTTITFQLAVPAQDMIPWPLVGSIMVECLPLLYARTSKQKQKIFVEPATGEAGERKDVRVLVLKSQLVKW